MKIPTVNIIEYVGDVVFGVMSFTEDAEGNKEAEKVFETIMREHGHVIKYAEVQVALEDGIWEQGNYQLFITHSS